MHAPAHTSPQPLALSIPLQLLGSGLGVYDPAANASSLNTENPPLRDTATLPQGGWTVLRFKADNPGVRAGGGWQHPQVGSSRSGRRAVCRQAVHGRHCPCD